jgi:hypothetical protein
MSSNKHQADRNALFGPSKKGGSQNSGPQYKSDNKANRDALFGGLSDQKSKGNRNGSGGNEKGTSARATIESKPDRASSFRTTEAKGYTSRGYSGQSKPKLTSALSGAAKMAKLKEAESYRDQAVKLMQRGVFTRPDPIMAANYYKRAADAYGLCGENRLERLHRVASADCQMGQGSYASAATEYARAGALVQQSSEDIERRRKEGWKFYSDAAHAWTKANERGKAANCQVLSALAWTWEDDTTMLSSQALSAMELAVESHVPDILNVYARYRQTGSSQFIDPNDQESMPSESTLRLAKEHMVQTSYAHEPLQDLMHTLVRYGEHQSALYACGAISAILEADGISTLTLGRNYVCETILAVAIGDPVMAEKQFLDRHVQRTHYLTSRECKLAEDLYRAVLNRDADALEEARAPSGSNKNAMANLHATLRDLIQSLRISGAARRRLPDTLPKQLELSKPNVMEDDNSSIEEEGTSESINEDTDKLKREMEEIMIGMEELEGLGDSDDDEELDDDDIDLR